MEAAEVWEGKVGEAGFLEAEEAPVGRLREKTAACRGLATAMEGLEAEEDVEAHPLEHPAEKQVVLEVHLSQPL